MEALTEKFDAALAGGTVTSDELTAEDIENIGYAKTACGRITENGQEAKIANYAEKIDALYAFSQVKKPTITGGTIKVVTNAQDQQLRFNVKAPTVPADVTVTEFGAVMKPSQLLGGQTLTLSTEGSANSKTESSELPENWGSVLLAIPNGSSGTDYCAVNITARAYVKVTVGDYTYISYSDAAERSVKRIASAMFTKLTDTATYPTGDFGDITYTDGIDANTGFGEGQTKPADLETVLVFLKANELRIAAIAAAQ